jgi:hypothetical protein
MPAIDQLPCGCRNGQAVCAESLRLWDEAMKAYDAAAGKSAKGPEAKAADEAMKQFNRHFHTKTK